MESNELQRSGRRHPRRPEKRGRFGRIWDVISEAVGAFCEFVFDRLISRLLRGLGE
jgi:hypothetical protein